MLRPYLLKICSLLAVAHLLGACASYGHVRFVPNPLDVPLDREDEKLGRALISIRGIDSTGPEGSFELTLRVRLDNDGFGRLRLVPEECELVDAALQPLLPPRVGRVESAAGDALSVAPGDSAVFDLVFPLAADRDPDDYDLSGLNLRWGLELVGREQILHWSSSFERARRDFPDYDRRYYSCHPWLGYHYHSHYLGTRLQWP